MDEKAYKKIKVLIADDNHKDAVEIISLFVITEPNSTPLYPEEAYDLISKALDIQIIHSVPDALAHIQQNVLPDIAIIDMNFKHALKHVSDHNEVDEGGVLLEALKKYEGLYLFCVTNHINWNLDIIEAMGDRAIHKNNTNVLTQKIRSVLQEIAKFRLATLSVLEQTKLARRLLHDHEWENLVVKLVKGYHPLKYLMIGWATLKYDDDKDVAVLEYPADIVSIIKNLLPYADT
jgi:hypothetical protein